MSDKDKFRIHITLNGIRMPLDVHRKNEVFYRNAEKLVKETIDAYLKKYPNISMEQVLTYAAFHIAVNYSAKSNEQSDTPLAEKIEELNNELELLFGSKTTLF